MGVKLELRGGVTGEVTTGVVALGFSSKNNCTTPQKGWIGEGGMVAFDG